MAIDAAFPLVAVVGYRGWTRRGLITDSVARYTEPFTLLIARLAYEGDEGPELAYRFERFGT